MELSSLSAICFLQVVVKRYQSPFVLYYNCIITPTTKICCLRLQTDAQLRSFKGHFTSSALSYSPLPLPSLTTRLISLGSSAETHPGLGDAQLRCYT